MDMLKALQIADVHLDGAISPNLFPDREERRREIREAFERAMDLAVERSVDVVLIPGDLWDDESVHPDTVGWLGDQFRKLDKHGIPLYIAPGNHDFYSWECGYTRGFWTRHGLSDWPSNVHVFTGGEFETVRLPNRPEVTITGRAFRENVPLEERLLAKRIPRPKDAQIQIFLFHGSHLKGFHPGGEPLITAPFEDNELLAQGFSYVALGHYHLFQAIKDHNGHIRAAYSGCLVSRNLHERGEKGALFLSITPEGVPPSELEVVQLEPRRIWVVSVDITGADHREAMHERMHEAIERAIGTQSPKGDVLHIRLTGRHPRGIEPSLPLDLEERFGHVSMENRTEPDYDLDTYRQGKGQTVDARFAREILLQLDEESDPQKRAVLKEALYLGLDALTRGQVIIRKLSFSEEEDLEDRED